MTTNDFKALNFNEKLTTTVATTAEAEDNVQIALQPFNEMEAKKERLIDLLTVAVLDLLIVGKDATEKTRAEGQLPTLPSMIDMRARIKTAAENVAPTINVNGKDIPDASRVSAICGSVTDSLKASFLIGAGFPDANDLKDIGTGFRLGYYKNNSSSKNISYQYCTAEEAFDKKGNLKNDYFASTYWKPVATFTHRIINGEKETNTSDWKHAKQADIRKAYNHHFLGYALNADGTDLKTNTKVNEEPTIYCVTQEHLKSDYTRVIDIMGKLNNWLEDGNLSTRYFREAFEEADGIDASGATAIKTSPTEEAFKKLLEGMSKAKNSLVEDIDEKEAELLREDLKQADKMKAKQEELKKDGIVSKGLNASIKNKEEQINNSIKKAS
tara:strand:- start:210 stop:1361 length:1152 start_codon:yes stop_codon:yes gene_type:complete